MDSNTQQHLGAPRRLHVVGNAHIDPVWIWDWREGMHEVLQTFGSALQRLEETPDLVFTASSAALYSWIQQTDPAMFDRIADAVSSGRWIITGGQWVEPDCNLPSGESMCRQFLYGQRYFAEHLGTTAKVGYNIDAFGHTASLPQLLAKSGLRAYVMMRPEAAEKQLPSSLFLWEGIDGTRIATYRIPFGYSTGGPEEERVLRARASELLDWSRRDDTPLMLFFGVGDHGGGPTKKAIGTVREIIERAPTDVGFSSPDTYFASIDGNDGETGNGHTSGRVSPIVAGELQWHAVGCFSAQSPVKRSNAIAERALVDAETLAVLCRHLTGRDLDAQPRLAPAWHAALFVQFHDSLAGTCAKPVYDDLDRFSAHATVVADTLATQATHAITQHIDTSRSDTREGDAPVPLVVFNPMAWPVTTAVTIAAPATHVTTDRGQALDVQSIASGELTHRPTRTLFQADVPGAGYRTFWLHNEPPGGRQPRTATARIDGTALDNGVLRVTIDPRDGVRGLHDLRDGRDWLEDEGLGLRVVKDDSDTWSHGIERYDGVEQRCTLTDCEILERGPVRATVRMQYRWQRSTVVQHVSLYAGRPSLCLEYSVDWHEVAQVLKIVVPVRLPAPTTTAGVPYGHIDRRPNGHEEVMQRWVDVHGSVAPGVSGGLACTTDWKYGYDAVGGRVRLTALRSPRFADHGRDWANGDSLSYPVTDQGQQTFSVRLHPHRGSWADVRVPRLADEHLARLPVVVDTWHEGYLPPAASLVTVQRGTVDVVVVKRAEAADATVVRVVETAGQPTAAIISLAVCNRLWSGAFGPHEVKTLAFPDDAGAPVREVDIPELGLDER